jgi:hypothetical protein
MMLMKMAGLMVYGGHSKAPLHNSSIRGYMPSQNFIGPEGLENFAMQCATALISTAKHQFFYPNSCSMDYWPTREIKSLNNELLGGLRHRANVYAIFIRSKSIGSEWQIRYVGQRKARELRSRLTQHLIEKNDRTGSKLELVKSAVCQRCEIGISYITVHPESLRLFVEESIIAKHKESLPWNNQG